MQHVNPKEVYGVYLTAHFHERLMDRYGLKLSRNEQLELCAQVAQVLALPINAWVPGEESVELACNVYGKSFIAIYAPAAGSVITCIHRRGTGHRKFVKKVMPTLHTFVTETREQVEVRHRHQRRANARRGSKPIGRPVARSTRLDVLED